MTRKMIVNAVDSEEVRIAILNDGRLDEFDIETRGVEKNKGNIYKARVIDVEPSLNAAFVDYGAEKQGFLTAGDVDPRLAPRAINKDKAPSISDLLREKQEILVQITKDEVGAKGAVLTTYLSLAGRYLVLQPESAARGSISRRIDDDDEREELKDLMTRLEVPEGMGLIVRTAGKDRSEEELKRDLKVLRQLWDTIQKQSTQAKAPALIFKEEDVIIRCLRDYFANDIDEVVFDSDDAFDRAAEYMDMLMPEFRHVLTRYVERRPIFHHYRIEEQLDALYTPRVPLYSGGSIVVERTEALVAIDVNSGKQKHGDHEQTAYRTNLEAAREVARQLKLRDLGGIIVVDFIDMMARKNQSRVERAMREAVQDDKARIKVGHISRNGTLELTRQRIRREVAASVFRTCSVCHGTGRILNTESHAVQILRKLRDRAARGDLRAAIVRVEPEAANHLKTIKWTAIQEIESQYHVRVDVTTDHAMSPGQDDFTFETDPNAKVNEIAEPNFGPAPLPDELLKALEASAENEEDKDDDEDDEDEGRGRDRDRDRGRGRGRDGRGGRGGDDGFKLPSFELVDPRDLGLKPAQKSEGRPSNDNDEGDEGEEQESRQTGGQGQDEDGMRREGGRRRRRRGRGRGRGGERRDGEMTAQEALMGGGGGQRPPQQQQQRQGGQQQGQHQHGQHQQRTQGQGGQQGQRAANPGQTALVPAAQAKPSLWTRFMNWLFGKKAA